MLPHKFAIIYSSADSVKIEVSWIEITFLWHALHWLHTLRHVLQR